MSFWRRLEERLMALQNDRPRVARYLFLAYWISNAVVVLGILVAIVVLIGRWPR